MFAQTEKVILLIIVSLYNMQEVLTLKVLFNCRFNSEGGLEYYSGKLYISDFNSDKVYTVAANISAIEMGQTLAIGRIGFANVEFGSIRDIAFTSNSTQQLPGK